MNHQKVEYFSVHTYPEMRVVDAVRASMAVPLYFEPLIINDKGEPQDVRNYQDHDHILLDGGFLSNFPIWVFDDSTKYETQAEKTIGFRIDSDYASVLYCSFNQRLGGFCLLFDERESEPFHLNPI
jgi:predicted acylesterase/phospholipase RssA